ncbi:hypothetical protein EV426DRAFT_703238 [Tirmania nivea]|nr:hypothetical protein EV426DRAFT_703238 [Tirmania nivea]
MEPAGLAIGVVGLTGQLAKVAMDCYKIFDEMNDAGSTYDEILHGLRTQGLLLKRWEEAWGFGGGTNHQRLDLGDCRYRYATASLARIVAVFASVNELKAIYGIMVKKDSTLEGDAEGEKRKARSRYRLSVPLPTRFRSKSQSPSTSKAQTSISGATSDDLHLLENPRVLENKQILPGLEDEITSMAQAIDRVQKSLPLYLKFRRVVLDKPKLGALLAKLTELNNGLFQVLPKSESTVVPPANPTQALPPPAIPPQGSPLKLLFDIPLFLNVRKDCEFVGREYLLKRLKREINEGKHMLNIIVLYGLGGMGKTQLALEYVYQYYHDYSSVFWVNAASVQTTILGFMQILQQIIEYHLQLSEDIAKIARLLGMAGKLDSTGCFTVTSESEAQHVVCAVKRWFSMPKNTNWLLVFDNLDDLDLVDIKEYLPLCNHGTVIITSRRRDIIQPGRRGFEVEQMKTAEAIQLLLIAYAIRKYEDLLPTEQTTANTIAQELGYLPLALSQAGAYIHISQYSLSRYLKEYQANASHLLNQGKMRSHDRSVFATWEISFKAIQEKNPKAAELLLVCGFFDHEDIPEVLLRYGLKLEADDEDSITTLFSYSLVKRGSRDDTFSIHPLVHSWARLRLKPKPQKEIDIATEAFGIIASIVGGFAKRCIEDWIFEQQVMPHVDAVTRYMQQYLAEGNIEIQDGANGLGAFYFRHGWYDKAMEWYMRALDRREKELGVGHLDTLGTVHRIASVFSEQGQYDKSLEWYGRVLAGKEKALGVDHPNTLTTVHQMASVFLKQGQYNKALEWYGRVLSGGEKALGVDHPDTLSTVHSMAVVFSEQGQYDKALEWYGRVLAGEEKALEVDHPSTLTTVHSMASVFSAQGQYDKALEWYGRVLAGFEKALGVDHPRTLTTVRSMAVVFSKQGQYDKALEWYGRVLAGKEKVLGVDHPDTLTTVHQMASVFLNQGQYDKALEWYGRVLASFEKALGVEHPSTLTTVHSMASVFSKQRQYDKALEWYGRVLAGREKALGVDHPDTLNTVHQMASVYLNQGQYDKALEWYGRVLAGEEKALGVDHPDTLTTVHQMASVFLNQGQYDKALEWYGRVLAGEQKALEIDHPDTLTTVHQMASVFSKQGQYDKALEWYGRVLAGFEKALGVDHPRTLTTVHEMAGVFSEQGQYDKALEWYGRVLSGEQKALGVDHPSTLTTVHSMASVFSKQGQYDKALEWYGRVLAGKENALGVDHPDTLTTVHSMALVFSEQGQYDKALEWFGRALSGKEKALGVDHPSTQNTIRSLIYLHEGVGQIEQAQGLRTRLYVPNIPNN